jgi:hypothetical protein
MTGGSTTADVFPDLDGDPTNFPASSLPKRQQLPFLIPVHELHVYPKKVVEENERQLQDRKVIHLETVVVVVGGRGRRGGVFWSFLDEKMMIG